LHLLFSGIVQKCNLGIWSKGFFDKSFVQTHEKKTIQKWLTKVHHWQNSRIEWH
jgi:hypothetical protein